MKKQSKRVNFMDPERVKKRRLIVIGIIIAVVIALSLGSVWRLTHYHRTDTATQQVAMNGNTPTVVMFYSKTCKHCHQVAPIVHQAVLASKAQGLTNNFTTGTEGIFQKNRKFVFLELQNSQDKQLFKKYQVNHTPTFMVFKNGNPQPIGQQGQFPIYHYTGTDKHIIKSIYVNFNEEETR